MDEWEDFVCALDPSGQCDIAFMNAYGDESGKHKEAKVITVAWLLAPSKEWQKLQRRWAQVLLLEGLKKPFHMEKCVSGWGEFRGWSNDRREDLQARLIDILVSIKFHAFGASVVRKEHSIVSRRLRHRSIRDPWFLAFESAINEMMLRSREAGKSDRINFVFDRQDEFSGRAKSLYDMVLSEGVEYAHRLGTLGFSPKDQVCALQAADLVVYEVNKSVTECKMGGRPERWQMERLRKRPIGGLIWDRSRLGELAEMVTEQRREALECATI